MRIRNVVAWFFAIRDSWRFWRSVRATYNLTVAELADAKRRIVSLERRLLHQELELAKRTTLGADIGYDPRGGHWAILVGRYGNRDYVETFGLNSDNFDGLVYQMRYLSKHAGVRRVDAPPGIRAVIDRAWYKG